MCIVPPATNFSVFVEEFAEVLVKYASNFTNILCLGDFNFLAELEADSRASRLFSVISEAGLEQHIHEPTHVSGHRLDLIISTYTPANIFVDDEIASDHNCINFNYPTDTQTSVSNKTVVYRQCKNITLESMSNTFNLLINEKMAYAGNCCDSFWTFFTCLNEVADFLAPEKKGFFSQHTCPYFDDELRTAKKERRRAERQYRKYFPKLA